jgi:hypothetical protein
LVLRGGPRAPFLPGVVPGPEHLRDELPRMSVLLVPPQGQAVNITGDKESITKFFLGKTPGRLVLVGTQKAVFELYHSDGKWSVVRVDGSQVTIDEESFNEEYTKLLEAAKSQD